MIPLFQPQGVQEDGNGAALEDGALVDGFMAVPVKEDEIVFRKKRLAANTVGNGSAMEDEPCPVCAEGVGCQFFRCPVTRLHGKMGCRGHCQSRTYRWQTWHFHRSG